MSVVRTVFIATTMTLLSGCANHEMVKNADMDAGHEHSFAASYEKTRLAALEGLRLLNITPSQIEEVPEGTAIYLSRPTRLTSWGEVGRVLVVKSDAPPTKVRALYERRFGAAMGAESTFSRNLFARMDAMLADAAP
ncbi:MAG: hypothetical protein ACM30I_14340 [Gemmatimonas sp.]